MARDLEDEEVLVKELRRASQRASLRGSGGPN